MPVPGSPGTDSPDANLLDVSVLNEIVSKLRKELEDKYLKEIQDLKDFVQQVTGGAPILNAMSKKFGEDEMLKPIDSKDIKKPDEFDGNKDFHTWFDRLKDLLTNRNKDWKIVLKKIEEAANKSEKIVHDDFAFEIGAELGETKSWKKWSLGDQYAHQLRSYLRSYTKGNFYDSVSKAETEDIFEILRATIKKGRNRNPYRMVAMKAEVLSPPRAKDAKELENVLNEWKFKYAEVQKYNPKFTLAEDTRKTLLMKVIPRDFVKIMREQFDRHDTYDDLEHQLLTEIATRQMEEEHYGKGKAIQAVVEPQPVTHQDHAYDHEYYYYYDSNCDQWIGALAPKRDREEVDGDEDRAKRPREDNDKGKSKGKGKKGARGPRAQGRCWTCGGPHQQWQCTEKGSGKGPLPTAWTAWRPSAFPGPSASQWRSWMPRFSPKGNGESKGKGKGGKKGSKGDGGKGVGAVWWNYPSHSVLGHLAHEHEEYGQGCQDQWQEAGCAAQSQFRRICAVLRSPIGIQNTFKILESDEADADKEEKEEERGACGQKDAIS